MTKLIDFEGEKLNTKYINIIEFKVYIVNE